jgi:hypothetical protein
MTEKAYPTKDFFKKFLKIWIDKGVDPIYATELFLRPLQTIANSQDDLTIEDVRGLVAVAEEAVRETLGHEFPALSEAFRG